MRWFHGFGLGAVLLVESCLMPPPASQRVTDAARELNLATRFGRMDVAVTHTTAKSRAAFVARHASWGGAVRVVDVELAGLDLSKDRALVQVDVSWVRADDGTLRSTRIAQVWSDEEGAWKLTREKRVGGDIGLFGEPVRLVKLEPHDVHLPSKTIR